MPEPQVILRMPGPDGIVRQIWIPLSRAAFCAEDETIFVAACPVCPTCGTPMRQPLAAWLREHQA